MEFADTEFLLVLELIDDVHVISQQMSMCALQTTMGDEVVVAAGVLKRLCVWEGYHVWVAAIEQGNCRGHYAVAVIKDGVFVGHLPRKISCDSPLFLSSLTNVE